MFKYRKKKLEIITDYDYKKQSEAWNKNKPYIFKWKSGSDTINSMRFN